MWMLLLSLVLGLTPAHAETIQDLIKRALANSAELRALDQDVQGAGASAKQAGRWDNPDVAVVVGPMTATLPRQTLNGYGIDASIRQSIPLFGQKSVQARAGEQERRVLESEKSERALQLRHEVVRLAYLLGSLNEQALHIAHRREKIEWVAQYLATRPFASPSQKVEKSLIQNRLREIEEKSLLITSMKEKTWQSLNVYLSLPAPLVPEIRWADPLPTPDRDAAWKSFQEKNPELTRQTQVVAAADVAIDQAGKKAYPDLRIGASYNEQSVEIPQRIYSGIVEFSIPILDRGGYGTQAARARKQAEIDRLEQKRRELTARFEQSWSDLAAQKKRIELYPVKLVPQLETELKQAEEGWKKSLVPVVAFLEIENQVHDQIFRVYDAQAEYHEALSRILYLSGVAYEAQESQNAQ